MSQGWICQNCGEANSEGFAVCMRCGEAAPNLPGKKLLTKSYGLDVFVGLAASAVVSLLSIFLGILLTRKTDADNAYLLFVPYALAIVSGIAVPIALRKSYRGLMLGVILGASLILNPFSACLAVVGFAFVLGQ